MIFVPLPRSVSPTARPPFFPGKGGVGESLLQLQFSSGLQILDQYVQDVFHFTFPHPLLEPAMAGLVRRILSGQLALLDSGTQTDKIPLRTAGGACQGRPPAIGASFRSQDRFDHFPLGIAESPPSSRAFLLPVLPHTENS
jgi:hypothetical protein